MSDPKKKCIVCAKEVMAVRGGICEPCEERIRREALGEQADLSDRAEREVWRQGVSPKSK